jgi:predicted cupin superfamily sugar epimerase
MADELSADEIRSLLQLEPHVTCGFVRITYLSSASIVPGGLPAPFANGRPMGSALYFMVTPTAPVRLHRIRNDQLYHYYLGDSLEVLLLHADGSSEWVMVGPDLPTPERSPLVAGSTSLICNVPGSPVATSAAARMVPPVLPSPRAATP